MFSYPVYNILLKQLNVPEDNSVNFTWKDHSISSFPNQLPARKMRENERLVLITELEEKRQGDNYMPVPGCGAKSVHVHV